MPVPNDKTTLSINWSLCCMLFQSWVTFCVREKQVKGSEQSIIYFKKNMTTCWLFVLSSSLRISFHFVFHFLFRQNIKHILLNKKHYKNITLNKIIRFKNSAWLTTSFFILPCLFCDMGSYIHNPHSPFPKLFVKKPRKKPEKTRAIDWRHEAENIIVCYRGIQ